MCLTTEQVDRIATTEGQGRRGPVMPAGCRRGPERRQEVRRTIGTRAMICRQAPDGTDRSDTVLVGDLSTTAVGFLSENKMAVGEWFVLGLRDGDGRAIKIRCRVRNSERGGFGGTGFLVAAEFVEKVVNPMTVREDDVAVRPAKSDRRVAGEVVRGWIDGLRAAFGLDGVRQFH